MSDEKTAPETTVSHSVTEAAAKKKLSLPWVLVALLTFALIASLGRQPVVRESEDERVATEAQAEAEEPAEKEQSAEAEPEPEPEPELTPEQQRAIQVQAFAEVFEGHRSTIATALSDNMNVQSVDKLVYDPASETVILDVTSAWASPDNQVDGAWELTREIATLYEKDNGAWWQELFVPNFRLVNSGTQYSCSADFMRRLANLEAGRAEWDAECR